MRSHLLVGAVALIAGAGCGSSGGGQPTRASIPAPANPATSPAGTTARSPTALLPTVPAALVGTGARVFTTREWARAGGYPAGTWTMVVDQAGQVTVTLPGKIITDFTSFQVTGSNLAIGGTPVCPGPPRGTGGPPR